MAGKRELAKGYCLIRWIIVGGVAGVLISSVVFYVQPVTFESTALLVADEEPGRTVGLSPVRAAQALRLSPEGLFWAAEEEDPIRKIRENTRIVARDGQVEISVRSPDKFLARDLALELSWLFRSMDEEERLGSVAVKSSTLSDQDGDSEFDYNRSMTKELMNDDCREAGLPADFRVLPTLVAQGSPEAKKLWESETFKRRWQFYDDATWKLAGEPRSHLPQLMMTGYPLISDHPVSSDVSLYQRLGLFGGVAVGFLVGHRRSLRITTPPLSKFPDDLPAYKEEASLKSRPASPEDEW